MIAKDCRTEVMQAPRLTFVIVLVVILAAVLPAAAQVNIATVPVENDAFYLAANPATNTLYVTNTCGTDPACGSGPATVTVINGATNTVTATITVGGRAQFLVVNPVTNKIYVTNRRDNTVSVIDGATNTVIHTLSVGSHPTVEDVNPLTNKIYVVNNGNGQGTTMSVIDGNTDTVTATVTVGNYPQSVSVDPVRNKVYVANYCGNQFGCNATPAPGTVSVIDGTTNAVTNTVTVQYGTGLLFVNPVTNKIYVSNTCGNTSSCDITGDNSQVIGSVTQIDGATLATQTVSTGKGMAAMANNSVANAVYITNNTDNTASLIDGNTMHVSTVNVGTSPNDVEVNVNTNTIFVCNGGDNTVTAINGATLMTTTVGVGNTPVEAWVNPVVNRIYTSNIGDNTVSVLSGIAPSAIQFVPVAPCRLVDTRDGNNPIPGNSSRNFTVPQLGGCNIPSSASAYSLNVTVVPPGRLGFLTIWPTGELQPFVSTMNSPDGRVKANAAIVPAGASGAVSVYVTNTTHVILDINGYFAAPALNPSSSTAQFYPLTPCRVVDTRDSNQPSGLGPPSLSNMQTRDLPILTSPCLHGVTLPQGYSFNVTVVPKNGQPLNYLTVWPSDQQQPYVSTLNNPTAAVIANGAIVPAAVNNGNIKVFASNATDVIMDINGYFGAPGGQGGLSLYATAPCRAYDSRISGDHMPFMGERTINVAGSACLLPGNAGAYVFNATVVPSGFLNFLTLWPDTEMQPSVSTLNAYDGAISSNMAIVPNANGSIDAYASQLTHLIMDISGYFAP